MIKYIIFFLSLTLSVNAQLSLFGSASMLGGDIQTNNDANEDTAYKKAIEFADFLYNEGEFEDASNEYLKLYFTTPNDSLLKRTAISFYDAKNYKMAETYLLKTFETDSSSDISSKLFSIYDKQKEYNKALALSKQMGASSHWFQSKYFYMLGDRDSAQSYLTTVSLQKYSINRSTILELMERDMSKKNHTIGAFASLIPGGGYLYTQRYGDALFTNVIVLPLAIISALYYVNDEKTKAYVWGGIGGVFYLGSIYGGINSVSLYNEQIETYRSYKIKNSYNTGNDHWIIKH